MGYRSAQPAAFDASYSKSASVVGNHAAGKIVPVGATIPHMRHHACCSILRDATSISMIFASRGLPLRAWIGRAAIPMDERMAGAPRVIMLTLADGRFGRQRADVAFPLLGSHGRLRSLVERVILQVPFAMRLVALRLGAARRLAEPRALVRRDELRCAPTHAKRSRFFFSERALISATSPHTCTGRCAICPFWGAG